MKFCRPIFRLIDKVDPGLAKKTFKEHASFYVSSLPHACLFQRVQGSDEVEEGAKVAAPYCAPYDCARPGSGRRVDATCPAQPYDMGHAKKYT
jgi:hypothetical protein